MKTSLLFTAALCVALVGCTKPDATSPDSAPDAQGQTAVSEEGHDHTEDGHAEHGHAEDAHAEHGHPEHGPHEGELIELGQEDYHAELVHGKDALSIYLLDSAATELVPIAAETLTLSLKHDGQVKSFELAASPEATDPEGQSSHFLSPSEELHDWLDAGAEGALTIEIEGKSYTGQVAHDHAGHDGHDH